MNHLNLRQTMQLAFGVSAKSKRLQKKGGPKRRLSERLNKKGSVNRVSVNLTFICTISLSLKSPERTSSR